MDIWYRKVPSFPDWELSSDGRLMHRGEGEVAPEAYANGDLKFVIDDGMWRYSGPCWRLMAETFYENAPRGLEPEFADGNRFNHSLDNLIFGEVNPETGLWEPIRWRDLGHARRFDRRLGRRIRINETGEVFDSLDEVADYIGGQKQNVSAVLHGRLGQHRGKTFSYVD